MRAQSMDMKDYIYRVVIPTETVVENKKMEFKRKSQKDVSWLHPSRNGHDE